MLGALGGELLGIWGVKFLLVNGVLCVTSATVLLVVAENGGTEAVVVEAVVVVVVMVVGVGVGVVVVVVVEGG